MAASFGALGDDDVDANVYVTLRVLRLASQRADEAAFFFDSLDHVRRWRPERVDNQRWSMRERDLEQRPRLVGREWHSAIAATASAENAAAGLFGTERGYVVAAQDVVDELDVSSRDKASDVVECVAAGIGACVLGRHDEVDAVGQIAHFGFDPGEVDFELLGRVSDRTEHTHASGSGDRGDNIAAMCERKDRNVDAKHVGNRCLHRSNLLCGRAPQLLMLSGQH